MAKTFDRTAEDFGNIINLEHINVTSPDQRLATLFYITGMGFTRDPYLVTGVVNMWVNIGRSQVHLPVGDPQVLRGHTGLVVPDLKAQADSLEAVRGDLKGTKFDFNRGNDRLDVICPWGNEYRCYEPDTDRFGPICLGMPYVQFDVPLGTADGIARFYREIFDAVTAVEDSDGAKTARISVGYHQYVLFRETGDPIPAYDGHHFELYLVNFSEPHERLKERGLITQESNQYQYRFLDIIDLDSGKKLYEVEHEIRSMSHPLFGRPFVNRNPAQTNRTYVPGCDDRTWATPYAM
ncbi:MAG: hypothetical protein WD407_04690 [Rhodospirillales bacterium]